MQGLRPDIGAGISPPHTPTVAISNFGSVQVSALIGSSYGQFRFQHSTAARAFIKSHYIVPLVYVF